jgi:hypothetical protein
MDIGFQLFIFEKRSFEIPLLATFASISLQCNNMGNMLSKPVSAKNTGMEWNVDRMVSSCYSRCSFCLSVMTHDFCRLPRVRSWRQSFLKHKTLSGTPNAICCCEKTRTERASTFCKTWHAMLCSGTCRSVAYERKARKQPQPMPSPIYKDVGRRKTQNLSRAEVKCW